LQGFFIIAAGKHNIQAPPVLNGFQPSINSASPCAANGSNAVNSRFVIALAAADGPEKQ
jgi:hypothetical protein